MINTYYTNYNPPVSFTGKTYSKKALKELDEFCDSPCKKVKKAAAKHIKAFFLPKNYVSLERCAFGYKAPVGSRPLEKYTGTRVKTAGFSTESGGYGGGWIKASCDTPLSTKDVHTCALVSLVNENTNEQLMYHVYSHTTSGKIKELIQNEFPRFNKVNIMPGDQFQTNSTVNNILEAVNEVNPKAIRQYYHMPVENPEVVSIHGDLKYLENKKPDEMTFTEVNQYNYD